MFGLMLINKYSYEGSNDYNNKKAKNCNYMTKTKTSELHY